MWADSCTSDTNKYKKIYFYSGSDNLLTSFKHDQKIYFGSGTKTVYVNPTETDATKSSISGFFNNEFAAPSIHPPDPLKSPLPDNRAFASGKVLFVIHRIFIYNYYPINNFVIL